MRQIAATSLKQEDNQRDLLEDHRARDHEASSMDFRRIAKNQELDLVEGSTPSETEKDRARSKSRICGSTGHSMS
jgi:uncharacterized Ntn-hydrolase superfamily protein